MKILNYILCLFTIFTLSACQSSKDEKQSRFEVTRIYSADIEAEDITRFDSSFEGKLYFSGVSFIGDMAGANSIEKTVPYAAKFYKKKANKNSNLSYLNAILRDKIRNEYVGKIPVELDSLAGMNENALGLSLVINYENYSVTKVAKYKRVIFTVMAQALVFNFNTKTIVASFPFNVSSLYDNFDPSPANVEAEFAKIYGKDSYVVSGKEINIFNRFINTLNTANIKETYRSTLGVANVDISDIAMPEIKRAGLNTKRAAKNFIASQFNEILSNTFEVPVMPYTYDSNIYINLAESFENESSLMGIALEAPNPDFPISLEVGNMRTNRNDNINRGRFVESYGILMNLIVKLRSSALLINNKYNYAYTRVFATDTYFGSVTTENYACLMSVIEKIVSEIKTNSEDKNLKNIIEKCK